MDALDLEGSVDTDIKDWYVLRRNTGGDVTLAAVLQQYAQVVKGLPQVDPKPPERTWKPRNGLDQNNWAHISSGHIRGGTHTAVVSRRLPLHPMLRSLAAPGHRGADHRNGRRVVEYEEDLPSTKSP